MARNVVEKRICVLQKVELSMCYVNRSAQTLSSLVITKLTWRQAEPQPDLRAAGGRAEGRQEVLVHGGGERARDGGE